jgi:hypothetical protein
MLEQRFRTTPNGSKTPLCNAHIREGELCKNIAVKDRDFCKHHGGKALKGIDCPQFKTGLWSAQRRRFSKVAPTLLAKIDEMRDDPELFSLRDDTAYITALMEVRAEAASEGISIEHYENLKRQFNICKSLLFTPEFAPEFTTLGNMMDEGIDLYEANKGVLELIERRADLIETEQKMMQGKAYSLEVDQAFSLIMQVLSVIKKCVTDAEQMAAINQGVLKLINVYKSEDEIIDAEVVDTNASTE